MEKQLTAKTENLLLEVWMMGLNANEVGFPSFDMAKTGGRLKEIINSLSPTEPATEKEPDVKDGFEKWLEERIANAKESYSDNEFNFYGQVLDTYSQFSPVSQKTEEKLKSIISDKPSNWYEKALERKVKKLEAELSQTKEECVHCDKVFTKEDSKVHSDCAIELAKCQTKGLDITDEEIKKNKNSEIFGMIVSDMRGLFSKQYDDEEAGMHFKQRMRHYENGILLSLSSNDKQEKKP